MSFWRKLNKVIFYICLVLTSIAVLVGTIMSFCSGRYTWWLGFVVLFGGIVLIPVIFSAWGILLEFLDNVAAIRRKVCDGDTMQLDPYAAPVQNIPAPTNAAPVQTYSAPVQSYAQPAQSYAAPLQNTVQPAQNYTAPAPAGMWICRCGTENEMESKFCYKCGSSRG